LDTGPLVAYLVANDQHHAWATDQFTHLPPPYITCEAVLSEACFLVSRGGLSPEIVLEALARGVIRLDFSLGQEVSAVRRVLDRYRDQGASLADACLVRMSELHRDCQVLTTDRDFLVYRREGRRVIPIIAPFGH
jgi:predicted nucleic acid-binding protein